MKLRKTAIALSLGMGLLVGITPTLYAQDIIAELKYRCDQIDGILDEDMNCLEPIEVEGGDVTIPLSDVELPSLSRTALPAHRMQQNIDLAEQFPITHLNPGNLNDIGNVEVNITQQEGLRMCFAELEGDVRNCHYAFQNNVDGYNECVMMAGESYQGCLTWVQKLPYEENQN